MTVQQIWQIQASRFSIVNSQRGIWAEPELSPMNRKARETRYGQEAHIHPIGTPAVKRPALL
jgi:hypothetical protein